jgi:class 3 adenylate cyclase
VEAVRTAIAIREQSVKIKQEFSDLYRPLDVNMGINSSSALLGAAKFETPTGSRWTYTAGGSVVNVAARIGAPARKGGVFMSKATADRLKAHYSPAPKGKHKLKNVSEEVDIFEL